VAPTAWGVGGRGGRSGPCLWGTKAVHSSKTSGRPALHFCYLKAAASGLFSWRRPHVAESEVPISEAGATLTFKTCVQSTGSVFAVLNVCVRQRLEIHLRF
jgi:hypothetical protein